MVKKIIRYGINAWPMKDHSLEQEAKEFMNENHDKQIYVSNYLFIEFCRLYKRNNPDLYEVIIIICDENDKEVERTTLDKNGRYVDCPKAFEFYTDLLSKLF